MNKERIELAPFYQEGNNAINEWIGYEITTDDGQVVGYVAPVMNYRTRQWWIAFSKPTRPQEDKPDVDMDQFDLGPFRTLKAAMAELGAD
jgi:hypothetical protein